MANKRAPLFLKPVLFILGLIGSGLNLLVFVDIPRLQPPNLNTSDPAAGAAGFNALGNSVYIVKISACPGSDQEEGTAFAVRPNYLITSSQTLRGSQDCKPQIIVVDSDGVDQAAELVGYSENVNLVLLTTRDSNFSPLPLADSAQYENSSQAIRVFTVSYPLVGAASDEKGSSLSSVGTARFDRTSARFITSGIHFNSRNGGGPVLLENQRSVLGVVSARPSPSEGTGFVIPSEAVKAFFLESTGQPLS